MSNPSLCGTKIQYGNTVLENILLNGISCDPVYDPTGVDPVVLKVTIDVITTLHTSTTNLHGSKVNWSLPPRQGLAPGLAEMIRDFTVPRQAFWLWIGGEQMFYVRPAARAECDTWMTSDEAANGALPDIAHGPRVSLKVLSVQGTSAVKCELRFELNIPIKCYGESGEVLNDLISLRWWIADDIDCSDWTTTRNYIGVMRVKSKNINPHKLARTKTLPPLTKGFRRERIGWHESQDGLTLTFTITDREIWANAPWPASDWEGTYTVSFPQMGLTVEQELNFRLKGSKDIPKGNLFNLAQAIIEAKLHWQAVRNQLNADANIFVLSSNWSEDLKHNAINVNVRAKIYGGKDNKNPLAPVQRLINLSFKGTPELGEPLRPSLGTLWQGGNPSWHNDYNKEDAYLPEDGAWGTLAGIFVTALQTPCCTNSLSDTLSESQSATQLTKNIDPVYEVYPTSPLAKVNDITEHYSPSHRKAMYEYYRMSSSLDTDTGWRAFPLGKQCSESRSYDTVAFSQIHCPVATRTIRIHASRINAWPELPKPVHWIESNGIKHVLKNYRIEPNPVQLSADGRDKLCEVYAVYEYYLSRPPKDTELIAVGKLPYISNEDVFIVTNAGTTDEVWLDISVYDQDKFFVSPKSMLDQPY